MNSLINLFLLIVRIRFGEDWNVLQEPIDPLGPHICENSRQLKYSDVNLLKKVNKCCKRE